MMSKPLQDGGSDSPTGSIDASAGVKESFKGRLLSFAGKAKNGAVSFLEGSYGRLALPAVSVTLFLSLIAPLIPGMVWWAPWLWFFASAGFLFILSRSIVVIKVLVTLAITGYCMVTMHDVAIYASPYSGWEFFAGFSPLLGLGISLTLSMFGTYGISRWTHQPLVAILATTAGVIVTAATLNPALGGAVLMGISVLVSSIWYRYGIKMFYWRSKMPLFVKPKHLESKLAREAAIINDPKNSKTKYDSEWFYYPYVAPRSGAPSPVFVVGDRAYLFFPVSLTAPFVLEEKAGLFGDKVKARKLTYKGKPVEPWLFDKVISRTPPGVIPVLMDVQNACPADKRNITLAIPDSPLNSAGEPIRYLEVGIINAREVNSAAKELHIVKRAEAIYHSKPTLDEKTQARLKRIKI